ncbi:MAG: hypothetical protein JWN34_6069 [Bryobacterales bacterium]|nr:hypothetical protein [Bryobacterales bacterium]
MVATEHHYTVQQLSEKWQVAANTIRNLFKDEPGVLKVSQPRLLTRKQKPHVTLRIPASVVERLHKQWSTPTGSLEVKRSRRTI